MVCTTNRMKHRERTIARQVEVCGTRKKCPPRFRGATLYLLEGEKDTDRPRGASHQTCHCMSDSKPLISHHLGALAVKAAQIDGTCSVRMRPRIARCGGPARRVGRAWASKAVAHWAIEFQRQMDTRPGRPLRSELRGRGVRPVVWASLLLGRGGPFDLLLRAPKRLLTNAPMIRRTNRQLQRTHARIRVHCNLEFFNRIGGGFNRSLQHRLKSIGRRFKPQSFPRALV
jgi:hypothetical protein